MNYNKCNLVAEIGATHIGKIDRAKLLIKLAALSGADYVKFQKRFPEESVPKEIQNKPHPNLDFSYGNTYLEHRKKLELSIEQHIELAEYCHSVGTKYSTSVWDVTSAKEVISKINLDYIKIPSACNTNISLLDCVFLEYNGDVHISTGMTTEDEFLSLFDRIINFYKCSNRVVIYHCTSEYPCPFDHIHLLEILKLKEMCKPYGMKVGFSDHGYGIAASVVGYSFGAEWIERHFIDDRTFKHTDAAASLEPGGFSRLERDLRNIEKSLTFKKNISIMEMEQRRKLKFIDDKTVSD